MGEGLFSTNLSPEMKVEITDNDKTIDQIIMDLEVGESTSFPISKKSSVTGRVSDLNRQSNGDRVWHTRSIRSNFEILVIRDR